ncbi:D-alanyl-D-alanine carboxypeptidase family protein [Jannaschia sp. 2305UL9-9]|uniref:D-alanyl-D-alanine carboxypeptidase family protein n=1 Tax=Jannaschia sp. 2305UL9-9 TaxID=3121638 RepID=UPI003528758C
MIHRTTRAFRALAPLFFVVLLVLSALATVARAAPYAELVMDARTGEVLRSRNADTRLHPASLTKMMTLYIAFEAVRLGEITLDTEVRISRNAADEPPSKLGLRAGHKIAFRYLIRAAAVKSANDAATAIGEAISGSESAFADRMNRTARALGMTSTTFRNAHGLTQSGHLSTARDMTVMGRRLFYDYPQYYNLFSRRSTDAGITSVRNTNRRLLDAYRGADGIKTGYTNAAGFNLVASAERDGERVIATVFGGTSTATRNARIAELLDLGFERAPSRVAERRPSLPTYDGATLPGPTAPAVSMRPIARGMPGTPVIVANASSPAAPVVPAVVPEPRPDVVEVPLQVVTRASTSGGRSFAISLRRQPSRSAADKLLLRTALQELDALDDALRRVEPARGGYDPSFVGLSEREANRACTRLRARDVDCDVMSES